MTGEGVAMRVAAGVGLFAVGVVAVLVARSGTAVGQPGPDYVPMNTRNLKLGILYEPAKKASVRQVQLFVSRDQGQTWQYEQFVTPDKEFFAFVAKEDGVHWFNMVTVFTDGTKDPVDVTRGGDPQKILIDATPPVARVASAKREGDEIAVEWAVDEKYPNDAKTKVQYRTPADTDWKDIASAGKKSARFNPNSNGTVTVRVSAEDLVGNTHSATQDVNGLTTTVNSSPEPSKPITLPVGDLVMPKMDAVATAPTVPTLTPPTLPAPTPPPAIPPPTVVAEPAPPAPIIKLVNETEKPAQPEFRPSQTTPPTVVADSAPKPLATSPTPTAPPADPSAVQIIGYTQFELPLSLEAGPSGVKTIDVYLTRDDGRSWQKWSTHDGKESSLRVNLRPRADVVADGTYGFRLVATSGAGLSDDPPRAGTLPDFRVQVDTTPPVVTIFEPAADPVNRDVLTLQWSVTDKNLGQEQVAVEWSESPAGPWKPVAGNTGIAQVAAGGVSDLTAAKLPNTGKYAWKVPSNLGGGGAYLRMTAWDSAGNRSEVATGKPIPVDLVKPRVRVQGIVPAGGR